MNSLYTESFPEQAHILLDGLMGKVVSRISLACALLSCFLWISCSSSKSTNVVANTVPTSVSLTTSSAVASNVSLEVGQTLIFTAIARGATATSTLSETFSFQSSNPAVVTIAGNGTACAGTWDSLTSPQVCTPGQVGTAQITATALGITSPPITVYVHQHITSIAVSPTATEPTLLGPPPPTGCLSKGAPSGPESFVYQATAMNGNTDITTTVGPFSWQTVTPSGSGNIVNLSALPTGSPLNQEIATASTPGQGLIFASASGVSSQTVPIKTCPVQLIEIAAATGAASPIVVNTSSSTTLNATVIDTLGMPITNIPLTWSSSNPISVSASSGTVGDPHNVFGSIFTAQASAVGAAAVTASCTPPTCNGGIKPSLPIYPESAISFVVRSSTAPTTSPTVYATTTACASATANPTNATCSTDVVPITRSSSTSSFAIGTPVTLSSSPNSVVYDEHGTNAFLGVDSSQFGQKGVMVFSGSSPSQFNTAAGKVLAVSPDGTTVIISDTADSPNQLFICTSCSSTSRTVSPFLIAGATAAAFSADGLKAYIVAGSNLYIYSKVDALQKISLASPATDVTFLGNGMFGYLAGGDPAGGASFPVCYDPALASPLASVAIPGATMVRALPDGQSILVLAPPDVQTVTATITGPPTPPINIPGCPAPRGFLSLADTVGPVSNLGHGSFTTTQLILSRDGSTAYILGETQPPPNPARLPFVIVFNINSLTSSQISLVGNATPLSASLSPADNLLFVGANDGAVHVIDTSSGTDLQQITFPFLQAPLCFGPGSPSTQVPETVVAITAVSQNGSNTNYTYSLTSGPALAVGETVVVASMGDGGNNGTFTISSVIPATPTTGTFTVINSSGVTAANQSGTGTVPITCNPDLVFVKP